jgi:iron(III) transport system substrate-binding protein
MEKQRSRWRRLSVVVALFALVGVLTSCGGDDSDDKADTASTTTAAAGGGGDLASLTSAAKEEGTVVWLTALPQEAAARAAAGFKSEYGIDVQFLEVSSNDLLQRYQSEASAGKISADLISVAGGSKFLPDAIAKGWVEGLDKAELPVLESGDFPDRFDFDETVTMSLLPWLIAYNSDKLDEADAPKTFEEMGDPSLKGEVNLADPASSDAYIELWKVVQTEYGDDALQAIAANGPRFYASSGPAYQALAAGEGSILGPAVASSAKKVQDAGAPVKLLTPPVTTGVEMQLMLTAPDKADHPNAAKLFANWLLTEDGNMATAGDDAVSVYDTEALPKGYESPPTFTDAEKAEIMQLLGKK